MNYGSFLVTFCLALAAVQGFRVGLMLRGPSWAYRSEPIKATLAHLTFALIALPLAFFTGDGGPEILLILMTPLLVPLAPILVERWRHEEETRMEPLPFPASFIEPRPAPIRSRISRRKSRPVR